MSGRGRVRGCIVDVHWLAEALARLGGLGFRGLGFRGLGFRGLGFRGLGGLGFRGLGV